MPLASGTKFGRYQIRSKIGEGGMGEVYLAEDTKLDRRVALKILPEELAGNHDLMRRFTQEAKAAAALSHPNIAHVYEIDENEGRYFIAMEYVDGQSLDAKIAGRPLPSSEILQIGIQLAEAVEVAHSKGITHRDIKPSNIIVTSRNQAKLLDFGLAKFRSSLEKEQLRDATTQLKTAEGSIMGTVLYMSPEQALGQPVDHRSDIFSTGAVLYEMATGKCPFSGSTNTAIIDRIIHAQPEAISRFNYGVPADLDRIIRKCLEKDKERRYQSARELLVDLENSKRDTIGGSKPSSEITVAPRRNIRPWAFAAAAVVLVLTIFGIYVWRSSLAVPTEAIDSIAVLPLINATGDPNMDYLSDGVTEDIINSLSQLPKLRVVPRVAVFRYKGRDTNPSTVGREMNVRAVMTGRVVKLGEALLVQIDLIDAAENRQLWGEKYERKVSDILTLQGEIANEISEKLRLKLTKDERQQLTRRFTQNPEAYQLYLNGRYQWKKYTKEGLLNSINYFNQAIEKDPNYALAYTGLADAYIVLALMYMPPTQVMPKAKEAVDTALRLDPSLAAAHVSMASYKFFYEWDWVGAELEAQRARKLNGAYAKAIEVNTNYDDEHHFYCTALDTSGKPLESIAEMRRALELDPLSVPINMEIGWSYYVSRDYDQAIAQCRKAIEMDPNFAQAYLCTAQIYEQQRKFDQAIADATKANELTDGDPGATAELGYALALAGRKNEARKLAAALEQKSNGEYLDPALIALVYIALDDKDEAFRWLDRAYTARSSWLTWLKVEPKFDPLRADPRFAQLVKRVGIV